MWFPPISPKPLKISWFTFYTGQQDTCIKKFSVCLQSTCWTTLYSLAARESVVPQADCVSSSFPSTCLPPLLKPYLFLKMKGYFKKKGRHTNSRNTPRRQRSTERSCCCGNSSINLNRLRGFLKEIFIHLIVQYMSSTIWQVRTKKKKAQQKYRQQDGLGLASTSVEPHTQCDSPQRANKDML